MTRRRISQVDEMVLLAALRLGEAAYSVSMIHEIEERTGRKMSHGAVFVSIERLEEAGLISTERGDPLDSRGGRPRRMVSVTPKAIDQLRENREALMRLWEDVTQVVDG